MSEKINENKTKSELLVEINNLKKQISDNEEFLTDIGIIQKETFMSRIEALEENTVKKIDDLIAECVSETGRDFPWILVDQKIISNFTSN